MRFVACLLALASCAVALPAKKSLEPTEEFDLSKIFSKNIYADPIHPVRNGGLPAGRIIGGTEVPPHSVPYQVALLINGGGLCGGSLISTTSVLTAAHCLEGASFVELRFGAHFFIQEEVTQVRITSTSLVIHEAHNVGSFAANDIGAILLPSPVTPNNVIQVVPLASPDSGTFAGSTAFLAGWGLTSDANGANVSPVLRGVDLNVLSNGACGAIYGRIILESNICTSGAGRVGGCNGDSGGPLVVDGVQVGLVSFGATECEVQYPTVYARISEFRDWIREHTGV